ncbi:membrane-spanning 4-domains subfamily A member 8-like [Acipenser oxyrinchus oxyrinchus]|uniref:Membrane-spanning 4-domains subfamily A member 8-like n=1 Tax=Acipenser oxyrinchus oxyrinchus TaxID=40147 RepID=A0AAD8CFL4_ACIOX|nr:membrane-spanning 4-domains subfamily A member 8-like [Acipenser oxyrinchus oxyrinchus]
MASFMDNSINIATQDEEVYQNILKRYEPACLVPKKPATLGKCLKVEPTALGIMVSSMDSSIVIATQDEKDSENILKRYEPACMVPKKPAPLGTFLNREPTALGAAQIMIGLITIGLGIVLAMCAPSFVIIIKLPFLTGFLFMVCGSLSAAGEKYPKILWVCLKMSLGSSLSAGIGIVLYCVDLSFWNSYSNEDQLSFMTVVIKGLLINLTVLEIYITLPLIIKGDK